MKKNIILPLLALLIVPTLHANEATSRVNKSLTIFNDVMRQLDINYADTLNYEEMTETAINQMLRQVDPYTVYIPEDKTSNLKMMTTGKYGGIGAMIMQKGDTVCISEPYEGMPAQKNGLWAGDRILEVDGKKVVGKTTAEVSSMLRGTPRSTVTLKLRREGVAKPFVRSFEREEVKICPISYAAVLEGHIGFIAFSEFTENSGALFGQTLDQLNEQNKIDALIIDLRGNGGGLISEAVRIMSLFVDKGTEVVTTKGKTKASQRIYKTPVAPKYPDLPLYVLVDGSTASAAEIVSGALQDLDRATLIGERTFGKGLVQSVYPIAYNGNIKVTTAKYYIPSGRCIQAIDYRGKEAESKKDSLKHIFHTKKGRVVKDGGGIIPDITLEEDTSKVNISYSLYSKNLYYEYAVYYHCTHDSIADPTVFEVSDEILDDFKVFLQQRGFQYNSETEKYFDDLIDMAKHEDIAEDVVNQLLEIKGKISGDWQDAFDRNKEDIRHALGREITRHYCYIRGEYAYFLQYDKACKKAKEIINN